MIDARIKRTITIDLLHHDAGNGRIAPPIKRNAMKCRVCGNENLEEAVKCKQCNALLRRPEAPVASAQPRLDGNPRILLAGAGAALLVIAAAFYLAFSGPKAGPSRVTAAVSKPVSVEEQIGAEQRELEKAQEQAMAELSLDGLYAPATFATREAIMQWSFAMKEAEEREAGHDDQWKAWRADVVKRIHGSSLEEERKTALAKKVEAALTKSEQARSRARAVGRQWAHATLDVYDYASSNGEHIDASGAEVRVRHPEVEAGFRSRLAKAQRLQREASKMRLQAVETRRSLLREAGIEMQE
jgi:hypothetical protein